MERARWSDCPERGMKKMKKGLSEPFQPMWRYRGPAGAVGRSDGERFQGGWSQSSQAHRSDHTTDAVPRGPATPENRLQHYVR